MFFLFVYLGSHTILLCNKPLLSGNTCTIRSLFLYLYSHTCGTLASAQTVLVKVAGQDLLKFKKDCVHQSSSFFSCPFNAQQSMICSVKTFGLCTSSIICFVKTLELTIKV